MFVIIIIPISEIGNGTIPFRIFLYPPGMAWAGAGGGIPRLNDTGTVEVEAVFVGEAKRGELKSVYS